jgi:hypothetical protein
MVGQPRAALGQTNRHVDGYDPEVAGTDAAALQYGRLTRGGWR